MFCFKKVKEMHKRGGNSPYITHHSQGLWTSGLCECHRDPYNCCFTIFCPCIVAGRIAEIVDRGTTACFAATCVYFVLENMLCGCAYSCMNRSKLRSHFSLPDAPCADFLVHCFCNRCALCQEHRELTNRGIDPPQGWEANVERWNREHITPPIVIPGMTR